MKKFYEDPSMAIKKFGAENVVTASGTEYSTDLTADEKTTLEDKYRVYSFSAANVALTF